MSVLQGLRKRAAAQPAHIVLSEGDEPRVVAGALSALDAGLGPITLIGDPALVTAQLKDAGAMGRSDIAVLDPATSPLLAEFTQSYFDLRGGKSVSMAIAAQQARNPVMFAALMVRGGHAAGTVGGAVNTTSRIVRAALQIVGKAPKAPLVSSFFLMVLPEGHFSGRDALIFADCGLVMDPTSEELAGIAAQSAASCARLLGQEPAVALLSFSSKGSARHAKVAKVRKALDILHTSYPDIAADGDLQFDAAFVPDIAASKAPGSNVAGRANVMVFPDLDSGNISYKIAQRIGGCQAIGPVLQGLSRPANDLSRGCTACDITNMIAVTTLQATTPSESPT